MSKPLLAILSQRPRLISELLDSLNETFELLVCDSLQEAEELLFARTPACFFADFEETSFGGHSEDRLLETLHIKIPDLKILLLTDDAPPEPLERRIACTPHLTHMRGKMTPENLISLVKERAGISLPETAAVHDSRSLPIEHPPYRPETQSESTKQSEQSKSGSDASLHVNTDTVLQGFTRRFETNSPAMKEMLAELEIAARHDVTILLIGETGAGKTFLSKLIHEVSPRHSEPFLHVACGALPAELIESELFGHMKGSFTSAHADKEGKFVAAKRGTVLLDEIDVLGPEQQVKLLKVIETGEFEPVGSNKTLTSQARLVVASNLELQPLVESGRFRPDLYYRLNMLKFEITPLRERTVDIVPLAQKFVQQHSKKHGIHIRRIDRSLFEALQLYPWPGNVRELENVIQRAVIYCQDEVLTAQQLPSHIVSRTAGPTNDPTVNLGKQEEADNSLGQQIALTEKELIEHALLRNNFSRTKTAKELGISRVTLYNKMKKYDI